MWTVHSTLFFRMIVRIERLQVRVAILVSYVPRAMGVGVLSGPGDLSRIDTHSRWQCMRNPKRSISTILRKIGDCEQSKRYMIHTNLSKISSDRNVYYPGLFRRIYM